MLDEILEFRREWTIAHNYSPNATKNQLKMHVKELMKMEGPTNHEKNQKAISSKGTCVSRFARQRKKLLIDFA